jgi:hypothetical protein
VDADYRRFPFPNAALTIGAVNGLTIAAVAANAAGATAAQNGLTTAAAAARPEVVVKPKYREILSRYFPSF